MTLAWLVIALLVGGVAALFLGRINPALARIACLAALGVDLLVSLSIWSTGFDPAFGAAGQWILEERWPWVPQSGISFHLAIDGLSLLFVLLTIALGVASVISSWSEIKERTGFFHFNLMWALAGVIGTFLAIDLFLFYFFWELMLIPMYFLIAIWGHGKRFQASIKFFIFTQAGGLLMLLAILGLYFVHADQTGVYTFDYTDLLGTSTGWLEPWLLAGFLASFAVKLPIVPLHTWLPDAHTEAPTAGSVILAGLLLKTGGYGLIRFAAPLFPTAFLEAAPVLMILAVIGIIYTAVLAFAQTDLKRLIAYTSVSHMGFVLLGICVWNEAALQGAVMQMLSHGFVTGALFVLTGMLQERIKTRELGQMGGLWSTAPKMGAFMLFFTLASIGLPGLGNFTGEFMVLLGTFRAHPVAAALASLGVIASAVYGLWMVQRSFHGPNERKWKIPDLGAREAIIMAVMAAITIWLGVYPKPVFEKSATALKSMHTERVAYINNSTAQNR